MSNPKTLLSLIFVGLLCGAVAVAATKSPPQAASDSASIDVQLQRVPPKSPAESMAETEIADGFRMELVAAEPDVCSPVAMAFDEAGRMFVVEMIDYSEKDQARLGRIRLLSDEDGDGKYETSRVFVDDLSWPTAVACYNGGIFIGDAPDILYCKDTDGDGKADIRDVIYTGFGRTNVQGLFNSFLWGLDHKIYGQTSSSGASVTRPGTKAPALELHNRDFCFDPKTLEIWPTTGGGQHGMSFNRWGDRFVCSNSDHLQAIVFEDRYVARNPYQSVVSPRRTIASDGPQAEVFRISPVEAWREARTKLRVSGAAPGPIEGGGRAAGYFTGSTGVTVYEGGLWPSNDDARVLISDVGSNLIHRKRLVPDGVTYRGDRIDKNSEFIRSRDLWFRPVQMAIGPEGGLYVMDMCREVIEHPKSIPAVLKSQLDLSSGEDRGRLYRVVPAGYEYVTPKSLAKAKTAELAAALDDVNQWRRMTALRLIYEQQDPEAGQVLREQLAATKRPEGRIAVLYALDSVGALEDADLEAAFSDAHPQVRRHALRLSEPRLDESVGVRKSALPLAADADSVVRFQAALSLGECRDMTATLGLAQILLRDSGNRDISDAVLTSIVDRAGDVLTILLADKKWAATPTGESVVAAIVGQIARQRRTADLDAIVAMLRREDRGSHATGKTALLKALSRLPTKSLNGTSPPQLTTLRELRQTAADKMRTAAERVLSQRDASVEDRAVAISDLTVDTFERAEPLLEKLLSPREPAAIHAAVIAACAQFESPGVAKLLLSKWGEYTPADRLQAIDVLLRRGPWALALVEYLAEQKISLTTLDPSHAARLDTYPAPKVRQLVRKLRGQAPPEDRQRVFQEYREVLFTTGDATKGKEVFVKNCSACHEIGGVGSAVGPNLAAMVSRGPESVLFNLLAPNVEVDPRFIEFVVLTNSGEVVSGVKASESSTAVTIIGPDKKTTTILAVDIDEINNTGKSLMPEGFEKLVDKKAMADLLEFLKQAAVMQGDNK